MLVTIIIFIAILSLLVFVHEFGHFITAKKAGIHVEEFGFGFPPRMLGVMRDKTIYSINWIPLGGFVRIKGESGEHARDKDSYASKSIPKKITILCAGVLMNVLLAWCLLSVGYLIGVPQVVEDLPSFARVSDTRVRVVSVLKDSPAYKAGLEPGDAVTSIDGTLITEIDVFRAYTASHAGAPVVLAIEAGKGPKEVRLVPQILKDTGRVGIGVALMKTGLVSYPLYYAPLEGARAVYSITADIFTAFGGLLRDLVVQKPVSVDFSGPVGIAVVTGEIAKMGFRYLLQFTALLSINLAFVNILPFPALDGGRVLFLLIEWARGKAVDRRVESVVHNIGFALLMILVLVVTYRDIVRFGGDFLSSVGGVVGAGQ